MIAFIWEKLKQAGNASERRIKADTAEALRGA